MSTQILFVVICMNICHIVVGGDNVSFNCFRQLFVWVPTAGSDGDSFDSDGWFRRQFVWVQRLVPSAVTTAFQICEGSTAFYLVPQCQSLTLYLT